jgi:hypothetical protein
MPPSGGLQQRETAWQARASSTSIQTWIATGAARANGDLLVKQCNAPGIMEERGTINTDDAVQQLLTA